MITGSLWQATCEWEGFTRMLGFLHAITRCSTEEEAMALMARAAQKPDVLNRWVQEGGDLNAMLDAAS